jgi:hypothetical protein
MHRVILQKELDGRSRLSDGVDRKERSGEEMEAGLNRVLHHSIQQLRLESEIANEEIIRSTKKGSGSLPSATSAYQRDSYR